MILEIRYQKDDLTFSEWTPLAFGRISLDHVETYATYYYWDRLWHPNRMNTSFRVRDGGDVIIMAIWFNQASGQIEVLKPIRGQIVKDDNDPLGFKRIEDIS